MSGTVKNPCPLLCLACGTAAAAAAASHLLPLWLLTEVDTSPSIHTQRSGVTPIISTVMHGHYSPPLQSNNNILVPCVV
jgi:hypothetical protein